MCSLLNGELGYNLCMKNSEGSTIATLVIADDHSMVREGTAKIAGSVENLRLVAEADNGLSAIAMVKKHQPSLLILDAAMPMARGIEVYAECRRWSPETRVLLQTGFTSANLLSDWLNAGIDGLVLKTSPSEQIEFAIRELLAGRSYVSEGVNKAIEASTIDIALTDREREVLAHLAKGNTNSMIGEQLFISSKTVEKHRASLMSKLNVNSVAELLVYALREGLLEEYKQLQ
jgi:DNA-binding NarL/FixJ family response regulator